MKKRSWDEIELNNVETELNHSKYNGLALGKLSSLYFDGLYRGDVSHGLFRRLLELAYYLIKVIFRGSHVRNYGRSIIYFRSGNWRHYIEIQNAIIENGHLKKEILVIGPDNKMGISKGSVFYFTSIVDIFNIGIFLIYNKSQIFHALMPLRLTMYQKSIFLVNLLMQLLKGVSVLRFVSEQVSAKLVGADYDRGGEASLFFAVSEACSMNSFTFQHGVINPPVGYTPINADEIWVWGEMARLQLKALGVPEHKIRLTGTPIIQDIDLSPELRQSAINRHGLDAGMTVVLALSGSDLDKDAILVHYFNEIKQSYASPKDNYVIKIHPSRKFSDYNWISEEYGLKVLAQGIEYQEFMNLMDILLAHTSGLATEALHYKKKVGVLDILESSAGSGLELNKYFGVPLLKNKHDFEIFLTSDCSTESSRAFYKIGLEAKLEIQRIIIEKLQLSTL